MSFVSICRPPERAALRSAAGPARHGALALLTGLLLMVFVCRDGFAAEPGDARGRPAFAADATGQEIYDSQCYFCHGYGGDARTVAAGYLSPPPRDFTGLDPVRVDRQHMLRTLRDGRAGTAMAPFGERLSTTQRERVVDYIRATFMDRRGAATRYHTAANGWLDHDQHRSAFPFARGEIAIDDPSIDTHAERAQGRRLFLSACITCHEPVRSNAPAHAVWQIRPVTFPPDYYLLAESGRAPPDIRFDPHHLHEHPRDTAPLDATAQVGKVLYAKNCASCHAADGSGRNWRGSFLDPAPPDLTRMGLAGIADVVLAGRILDAPPGSSMPAWRSVLTTDQVQSIVAYLKRAMDGSQPPEAAIMGHASGR